MKKFILILTAFVINFILINLANAENFVINNYSVKMDVKENRTIDIFEEINVFFTANSHGIYRIIPLKNKIVRENGTKNTEFAKITNVSASQLVSKRVENNRLNIKMGDPFYFAPENQTYTIKYNYDMGRDRVKNADEFYFNIIGTDWDTTISKVYFSITLPNGFDSSKVGFSMGRNGISGYNPDDLKFKITGNTIKGYTTRYLNPHEGLTVRIELPENYFTKQSGIEDYIILTALLLTIFPVILWALYGRDDPVTPVVTFNPPENKNSAEIEVEYKGTSTNKGITSLIFYLASKGYLEIEDNDIGYTIKKIKEYDGKKSIEKALMEALFKEGSTTVSQIELETSSRYKLYCNKIQSSLNKIRNYIFEKNSCSFQKLAIIFISIIGLGLLFLYTLGDYSFKLFTDGFAFLIIFPVIAIIIFSISLVSNQQKNMGFITIWSLGFGGIPAVMLFTSAENIEGNYPVLLTELACIIVSIICLINMPKRNTKGRMLLGEILGFKKFLEVSEKPRLIALINENPNYVSEVLPFAYILDVADNLIDCIENYEEYKPYWYKGRFNREHFHSIASSVNTASAPPSPSSSSHHGSHGHSGGGHSGGGHGGGGGGSW